MPVLFSLELTSTDGCDGAVLTVGGQQLRYDGKIAAGKALAIQANAKGVVSCRLDGKNVIKDYSGGLKKLPPGLQRLKLEAPGNTGTVTAKIKYREARSGV